MEVVAIVARDSPFRSAGNSAWVRIPVDSMGGEVGLELGGEVVEDPGDGVGYNV